MIKLLLLDVDGTLTSGEIIYTANGDEIKPFDVKDGLAVSSWVRLGNFAAIITGRNSTLVERRAKELGITHIYQGIKDKYSLLLGICEELEIGLEEVAAIGDDLNDLKMLQAVGKSFAPADAAKQIREMADHVMQANGGRGAVREAIEMLFSMNGQDEAFMELWT